MSNPSASEDKLRRELATLKARLAELEQAEESAERQRRLLAHAERLAHVGAWEYDPSTREIWVSDEWRRIHGTDAQTLSTEQLSGLAHPDDLPAIHRAIDASCTRGEPYDLEHRIVRADTGEVRWVHSVGHVCRDDSGEIVRMYGAAQDITERKQRTEQLERQNRFQRALLEAIPAPVFYKGVDGRYLGCNRAFEEYFGAPEEDIVGRTVFDIAPKETAEEYHAKDRELFENPEYQIYESRVVDVRGVEHEVIFHKAPFEDAQGRLAGLIGVILDITHRKRIESALIDSEQRYRTLFNLANDAIVLMTASPEGLPESFTDVNYTACRMLGYDRRDLLKLRVRDILTPEAWQALVDRTEEISNKNRLTLETELLRRDGATVPVEVSAHRFELGGERIVLGVARDIAERRRSEQALRQAELERRAILDSQPQHVILHSTDFAIAWANRSACESAGLSREEIVGRRCWEFWGQEGEPCADCPVRHALRTGESTSQTRPGSDGIVWRVMGSPVTNDRGEIVGAVEVAADITYERQLEEQLRQAQKMEAVGQLAGGVAHDFRNQLTVIHGFASLVLRRDLVEPEGRDKIEEVIGAAERATHLTDQLLAFSRREALHPEVVNLSEQLWDMGKLLPRMIGEDVRLTIDPPRENCLCEIDPRFFQQAIMNLVINARDAMVDGGELRLGACAASLPESLAVRYEFEDTDGYVRVSVRDTGVGMDKATRERIFEPFFTTKESGRGTGLGLSMVYGFVRQSHGVIECESAPGEGTRFDLYFPATEHDKQEREMTDTQSQGGTETILVVEDEEAVRRMIDAMLREMGYRPLIASCAREATDLARRHRDEIDLLIADVVMPDVSGVDVSRQVLEIVPDLPVLFVSGYVGDELERRGIDRLPGYFLQKAFSQTDLALAIRGCLEE